MVKTKSVQIWSSDHFGKQECPNWDLTNASKKFAVNLFCLL